jgi:hypothetical protein
VTVVGDEPEAVLERARAAAAALRWED